MLPLRRDPARRPLLEEPQDPRGASHDGAGCDHGGFDGTDRYQKLAIRQGSTDFLRIEIRSVYGSREFEDCLLSEVEFYAESLGSA